MFCSGKLKQAFLIVQVQVVPPRHTAVRNIWCLSNEHVFLYFHVEKCLIKCCCVPSKGKLLCSTSSSVCLGLPWWGGSVSTTSATPSQWMTSAHCMDRTGLTTRYFYSLTFWKEHCILWATIAHLSWSVLVRPNQLTFFTFCEFLFTLAVYEIFQMY